MRKTELLIGAAALVLISISATIYVVNQRARSDASRALAQTEPEQVLSPSELLGPATGESDPGSGAPHDDSSTTISIEIDGEGDRTEGGAPRAHYPAWRTSGAHVEGARAITAPNGYISPKWSPLGIDLAFTRDDFTGIYLAPPTPGGEVRRLMLDTKAGANFRWKPDGMALEVMALDGRLDEITIVGERLPAEERQEQVVAREDIIYYMASPLRGREGEVRLSGPEDRFSAPVVSPDGTKVVFRGAETGLYVASVRGNRILSIGPGSNPTWLPDSSGIVYDRPVSDGRTLMDGDLWLALANGSIRTNLTETPGVAETHPAVAPDGERIAFSAAGALYVGRLVMPSGNSE